MDHNETKKALECCVAETEDACVLCPLHDERWCVSIRNNATLDLINRYEAEIERLEAQNGVYETCNARKDEAIHHLEAEIEEYRNTVERVLKEVQEAKALWVKDMEKARADAVKEFAEMLKATAIGRVAWDCDDEAIEGFVAVDEFDILVKEFTGDNGEAHEV